jgi:hypothetical protein
MRMNKKAFNWYEKVRGNFSVNATVCVDGDRSLEQRESNPSVEP